MAEHEWKSIKKYLTTPKLLKSGLPEVLIEDGDGGLHISAYEKRRFISLFVPSLKIHSTKGTQYSVPFDHPLYNENDVTDWEIKAAKDTLKLEFTSETGRRHAELRKKAKPIHTKIPEGWRVCAEIEKQRIIKILDHLEASASVKDTKNEEDARINAVFFRPDISFTINRHTASVTDGFASIPFSIPSLDYAILRSFAERWDSESKINFEQTDSYFRVGNENCWLYLTRINSREPSFTRLSSDYSYEFTTSVTTLKSLVRWSEYNADASSYMTLVFTEDQCEIKTKFKVLGNIKGVCRSSPFSVDLPSKNFVNLVEYLMGDQVIIRYGHPKMSTIFNLHVQEEQSAIEYDHFIQTVRH